jgi:hypothetical protein
MLMMLVTGGREFNDAARVARVLDGMQSRHPGFCVVQGGARGADMLAKSWCQQNGVPCITFDAHWEYYGKRAGGLRNGWMLDYLDIDFVAAFPGGPGTADMKRRAKLRGIPVYEA